jgi:hypothetical protein
LDNTASVRSSSTRFCATSNDRNVLPGKFRPGRARLCAIPSATGSPVVRHQGANRAEGRSWNRAQADADGSAGICEDQKPS